MAWISYASQNLVNLGDIYFCPGAMTPYGPLGAYVTRGEGWDGPGLGSAALTYYYTNGTPDISESLENPEILRGIAEWAKYVQITFTETTTPNLDNSIDILWAVGDHGDGSPFDGAGGVLAHAYYPSANTIGGDIHFDDDEYWSLTGNIHVFTVALHEAGHSLGIAHSDVPGAVMEPFYSGVVTGLHADDIAGIQSIYAPKDAVVNVFTIENIGSGALTINSIDVNQNWLSTNGYNITPFTISALESKVIGVDIDWSLVGGSIQTGDITINSDDPDESQVTVNITAKPDITIPVLSVSPAFQTVSYIAGVTTFNVSNDGSGTMDWTAVANDAWLIINSGESGTNAGVISVDYTFNNSNLRTGTITVFAPGVTGSPSTVEVRQEGVGGGDFEFIVTVLDNNSSFQTLTLGTAPDATDGYDASYDQIAPPPPPSGSFDARFTINNQDFFIDYRASIISEVIWKLSYQPSTNGDPIKLSWDNTTLPSGSFHLTDVIDGSFVNINMKSQGTYEVSNLAITQLQIRYSIGQTSALPIREGWNFIGLPLSVTDNHYLTIFPNAITESMFGFDGSYTLETNFVQGKGYWLRFPTAESVTIRGSEFNSVTLDLLEGWNLISGISSNISLSQISDPGNIIIPGTLYSFNGSYQQTSTMAPGKAYWIRANNSGQIILTKSVAKRASSPDDKYPLANIENFSTINVKNNIGDEQNLYFNVTVSSEIDDRVFGLPPIAPGRQFDVRYDNDRWLARDDNVTIFLQSQNYPLTLKLLNVTENSDYRYVLIEKIGNVEGLIHDLENEIEIIITDPTVTALSLRKISTIPSEIHIFQNYPNPFNSFTEIRYEIPKDSHVKVVIWNLLGQRVKILVSENQRAGIHKAVWDAKNEVGRDVTSGIYFVAVNIDKHIITKKIMYLK